MEPPAVVCSLLDEAKHVLKQGSPVEDVYGDVFVVGDIHGNLFDLFRIFSKSGYPPHSKYLFLGDYVDRGYYSVETFTLLLALKVRYPSRMTLLRGNHESRQTTQAYGFYDEVIRKYNDPAVWQLFNKVFDLLPLCAVVGEKIFCVHGGLSPIITSLEQIQNYDRKKEIPERGPMCDLLWSDPDTVSGFQISPRGAGYIFGDSAVQQFNRANKLTLICRAHQLAMEGYVEWFDRKLFTVWSAPNYMYRSGNRASIMEVSSNLALDFKIFDAVPNEQRRAPPDNRVPSYFA